MKMTDKMNWNTDDYEELEWMKAMIAKAYYKGQIQMIDLDDFPDCDEIQFEEIDELATDISQGTGNVVIRYFYFPAINVIGRYADF